MYALRNKYWYAEFLFNTKNVKKSRSKTIDKKFIDVLIADAITTLQLFFILKHWNGVVNLLYYENVLLFLIITLYAKKRKTIESIFL